MKTVTVELLHKSALIQLKKMEQDDLIKLKIKAKRKFKEKLKSDLLAAAEEVRNDKKGITKLKSAKEIFDELRG